MSQRMRLELLVVIPIVLVLSGPFSYNISSLVSRFVLVAAFLSVLISIILAYYWTKEKTIILMLFFVSLLFLLWRSHFIMPYYIERALTSETFILAQSYGKTGHLVFGEAHSYFFLLPLILHFLYNICGISALGSVYLMLSIYGFLTTLIGILILKAIHRRVRSDGKNNNATAILPPIVAFSLMAFAYSERSVTLGGFMNLPLLLMLLGAYFFFDKGFKGRSHVIIMLLLIIGVTFGSSDGILFLAPFFLLFSMSRRTCTAILYALIPIYYMIFAGYSYTMSLKGYATFAWNGFLEFLEKVITGQLARKVIPWERTISITREDAFVASVAYLSLMLVSLIIVLISTSLLVKRKKKFGRDSSNILFWSKTTFLWLMLIAVSITYIGAAMRPETIFSDIRTIPTVFLSLLLPFQFISKRYITKINVNKILLALVITLMVLASLRTTYELYPKSIHDPINTAEDVRLGSANIYIAGNYINSYYKEGGIIIDNTVRNRLSSARPARAKDLVLPLSLFPEKSIFVFNIAGIKYPSRITPPEAYVAVYNFSMTHSLLYNNGAVLITSHR